MRPAYHPDTARRLRHRIDMIMRILVVLLLIGIAQRAPAQACPGDCDSSGNVVVNELVLAVSIALTGTDLEYCNAVDTNGDARVSIDELVAAVRSLLGGCGNATPAPSPTPTPVIDDQLPPTMSGALVDWLQSGRYSHWASEGQHPGSGPHFGDVRTFVNAALDSSLGAANEAHPVGAAAVKELFGRTGSTARGWAVAVKVAADSGGNGWYWLEYYNGGLVAAGVGNGICTGCHGGGTDYVCTPYPLQTGGQVLPPRCP